MPDSGNAPEITVSASNCVGTFSHVIELLYESGGIVKPVLLRGFHVTESLESDNPTQNIAYDVNFVRRITGTLLIAKPDGNYTFNGYLSNVRGISVKRNISVYYTVDDAENVGD